MRGDDSDMADPAANRCEPGTYCKYAIDEDSTEGDCTAQGTAGQSCDPRYGSAACLNGASCVVRNDAFVCNSNAIPAETLFCDGG